MACFPVRGLFPMGGRRVTQVWPVPLYTGVNLVGSSVQNNAGILSGFTSSSYATMPYYWTSGASQIEAVIKFTLNQNASTAQGIWGCVGSVNAFTPFYIYGDGRLVAYISSNGSSWNIEPNNTITQQALQAGTYIWRCKFDGGYSWQVRSASAWSAAHTNASTSAPYGASNLVPQLGTNRGTSNPLNGTIDLNYTYLYRDGELWWEGAAGAYRNVKTEYPDA